MIPLLVLNLGDFQGVIAVILFCINVVLFVYVYKKRAKQEVDKDDLDEVYTYIDKNDNVLHGRIDKMQERQEQHMKELRDGQQQIINHILNCTKR
jgi:cbb3-type cytochrome oxidase subunit 3